MTVDEGSRTQVEAAHLRVATGRNLVVFAHERTHARTTKRLAAFADLGWQTTGFSFHRRRPGTADHEPFFANVDLGETRDRAYGRRLLSLGRALFILRRERAILRRADALYVFNTDNALLALAARMIARRKLPVFLEIADILSPFTDPGLTGRLLRWIERRVLARTSCLVTTSPGFVREYFGPLQHYRGPLFLLENKVYPSAGLAQKRAAPASPGPPWRIGWFGALRCRRSWDTMRVLAGRHPDLLHFVVRGYPTAIDANAFFQEATGLPNLEFGGPYRYPEDLAGMHAGLHFVWAFDFSETSTNSRWLLPNRLYEGGLFHVPMLAARGTETGRWVESRGVGAVISADQLEEELTTLFSTLTAVQWQAWQHCAAATPDVDVVAEPDYAALSARMVEASNL